MDTSDILASASVIGGVALVLIALRDIMHTLLVPQGRTLLSSRILRAVWRISRMIARRRPGHLRYAGPRAMVVVVIVWCSLLVGGWALVYLPFFPSGFVAVEGIPPEGRSGFGTALYYSAVALSTMGFGDLSPLHPGLRYASALQGLIGFVLLTALISWLLSVYPVLSRQRTLAQEVDMIRQYEEDTGESVSGNGEELLSTFMHRVMRVEADLTHTPVAYYFVEREERASLAAAIAFLLRKARRGQATSPSPQVRLNAELLERAIAKLTSTVRAGHLPRALPAPDQVLIAWGHDHGWGNLVRALLSPANDLSSRDQTGRPN